MFATLRRDLLSATAGLITMSSSHAKPLGRAIALFLPGIFLLGFNIGTGSVTAMAKAGATYGMSLTWTIVASCLATFCLIHAYGRFTLVTGETALWAFRRHLHPAVGIFFIVALTAGVSGSVMGVMGIVAEVCHEWSKSWFAAGVSPTYFAAFFVALVIVLFWNGTTEVFQRALAILVAVMAVCFVANFFLLMPSPETLLHGLLPSLPEVPADEGRGPFLVIASMVGTTVFSGLFIIRTTLVKEAGWTVNQLSQQRRDAAVSAGMMLVISIAIMGAAAGTLHDRGVRLEHASQMIELLEPIAGRLATVFFAIGIIAAGVSSQFPNVLMLPWLLCDYNQSPREMTMPRYRVMVVAISLLGLVVPIFGGRPVFVMIVSQAFNSIILPATVGCILYLGNHRSLMGTHCHGWRMNLALIAILLFSLATSAMGIHGVWLQLAG